MFSICGTTECLSTTNALLGLFIYILCIIIILIIIYFNNKFLWYAFFENFISVITFIIVVWIEIKYYLCYCGNFSNIIIFLIGSILSTFIIPIFIISIIYGENLINYLNKIYKKIKRE